MGCLPCMNACFPLNSLHHAQIQECLSGRGQGVGGGGGGGVQAQLTEMKKVNKQCLLDTPRTVRVSEKTWQVIVRTRMLQF